MRTKGEGSVSAIRGGFRGHVTIDGKRKYTAVYSTPALAGKAKTALMNRRDDGRITSGKAPSVAAWLEHWQESIGKHRPTTYANDKWIIENRIVPSFGNIKIDKLTQERIEEWLSGLRVRGSKKKLAVSSQRRYLAPLRTALNVAKARGHIAVNPAEGIELGKLGKRKTDSFSTADRDAILAVATGRNRARWYLALKIGLRPAEALGLTWHDFDPVAGTLTIRTQLLRATGKGLYLQESAKTEAGERKIILPASIVILLKEHRVEFLQHMAEAGKRWLGWDFDDKPVALMFTQPNGKPIGSATDILAWRQLLDAAGLAHVKRYKSRHTAATHMLIASGQDVVVTAKNLGHSDPAFTYRAYVHPLEERERALALKMDEA